MSETTPPPSSTDVPLATETGATPAPEPGAVAPEAAQADAVQPGATEEAVAPVDAAAAAPASSPLPAIPPLSPAEAGQQLKQLFPALFGGAPKPLKLRIQVDIQERAPGKFSKQTLSAFFRRHTGATSYLMAVTKAAHRFDLDGQPAGEITDEHRKVAQDELARRRGSQEERRQAEEQQRHLEDQQRRNRAGLLHDFQTTTLTKANFCALKGVAVDELDGLLERARGEAEERARHAPPPHQRQAPAFERPRRPNGPARPEGGARPPRRPRESR